jgi:hypothetical protein
MATGGLTGAGGSGWVPTTLPQDSGPSDQLRNMVADDPSLIINYTSQQQDRGAGRKPGAKPDQQHADAKAADEGSVDEQRQKAQDFDRVQGRLNFGGDRQQDGDAGRGKNAMIVAGTVGVAAAGGVLSGTGGTAAATGGGAAATGWGIAAAGTVLAGVGAAGLIIFTPTNAGREERPFPGSDKYRIAGAPGDYIWTLQSRNPDGTWSDVGGVPTGLDKNGATTVDMAKVNDVLKDRGFEPITLPTSNLPGFPDHGPKGPSILADPDQSGQLQGSDTVSTPNNGPRGAVAESFPISEEQGPQVLESRNTKADGRLKELGLPTEGEVTFDPSKGKRANDIKKDGDGNFKDKYENTWKWDNVKSEWDVTLTDRGKNKFGHLLEKGRGHLNVSPEGKITH